MNGTSVKLNTKLVERIRAYATRNGHTIAGYINNVLEWSIDYDEAEEQTKSKKKKILLKQQ